MPSIVTRFLTFFAAHGLTHMLTIPLDKAPGDWRALRYTLSAALCFVIVMGGLAVGAFCLNKIVAFWPF